MAVGTIPLARLHGSDSYQSFIMDTLPGASQRQDSEAIKETLKKGLLEIRDKARAIKGDLIRIGAISHPAYLSNFSISTLFHAVTEFDENLNHIIRFRLSHYGVMLTYPPSTARSYGAEIYLPTRVISLSS